MEHSSSPSIVEQAIVVLVAACVAVPLFRRAKLGSILGYLAAGVAIGPSGIGFFKDPGAIMHVAELGVVLFLFIIGLEMNLSRLWSMRRDIFGLGGAQVIVSGPLLMLYPLLVAHRTWQAALIAGLGLALSSTAMVMQLLEERGQVQSPHGRKAFSILLFQDLSVVPLLALVAFLSPIKAEHPIPVWLSAIKMLAALGGVIGVGRYLLNPFFRILANTGAKEIMTAAALLVVLAAATVMTMVGLSSALGAFLAGIMLAESSYRHELEADIEPFRGLLLGLFFVSVGMSVDLHIVPQFWMLLLGALVTLTIIKVAVVYGLVRLTGGDHENGMMSGALLSQGGEFAFVLFATAVSAGVMPQQQATLLVTVVTMSMALTPLLVALAPKLIPQTTRTREENFEGAGGSVLMIGFGRFGQIASQMLLAEGIEVTAIDNDIEMIEAAERFGFKVYFGDGQRLDVLRAAGGEKAEIICVCVDKREVATKIVEVAHEAFPLAKLYVRAFDRGHVLELVKHGIDFHMRETLESAIAFGRVALEELERTPERIAEIEADFRIRDRERLGLQQQGDFLAGKDMLHTRPAPKPQPFIVPARKGVVLHDSETNQKAAEPAETDDAGA